MDRFYKWYWHISKFREYPGIHKKISELSKEKYMDKNSWYKIQEERLRSLLDFSGKYVPYYRRVFEKVGFSSKCPNIRCEIEKIPILTKEIIRNNWKELIAENTVKSEMIQNSTGGSTGEPLTFYQDNNYWALAVALDAYVRSWWDIKPYDKTAWIWGADREFSDLTIRERIYNWLQRVKSLNAFRMTESELLAFCKDLAQWKPPYLMGYSSALEAMARCARKYCLDDITFKAIRSSAEMLWPYQRNEIEEVFNCPVFNFYGSREVNNIAAEDPICRKLHLISTWRLVEITNEAGQSQPLGSAGFIIVTDLSNYAMPFIRYQNQDIGRLSEHSCLCGRVNPVLDELIGRSSDIIRTPEGNLIHGEFFTHLFYGKDDIVKFQVHQTYLDKIVLRYIPASNTHTKTVGAILDEMKKRVGPNMSISIQICSDIPLTSSGKHRFTISDVQPINFPSTNKNSWD